MAKGIKNISPWAWVPTLYFAEGIPYVLVNEVSKMMFTDMGVPEDQLTFFTTLLIFPWFLKGLWSPFVEIFRSKRWWIIGMQATLSVLCICLTIFMPHPSAQMIAEKGTSAGLFTWTLIFFIIAAFASATHDIAADGYYMLALDKKNQARFVGIRSTFYRIASVFAQGVLVYMAGRIERNTGDVPMAWQITLGTTSALMLLLTLYHSFFIPRVDADQSHESKDYRQAMKELKESFVTFFTKPGVFVAIAFLLLYRLSEGFIGSLSKTFLKRGLGLETDTIGLLYGTIGVVALLAGGIIGGIHISRKGLKRSIWLMAAALTLPSFVYCYLSMAQPDSNWIIGTTIAFEQFGYGFGFTAYMMYMMQFADGKYKTAHYAICTAFMALSWMLPGFVAGSLQMAVGYTSFFWIANAFSVTTFIVTYFVYKRLKE